MSKYVIRSLEHKLFSKLTPYLKIFPHSIIGGGCFKNIYLREKLKDIDIFFSDKKQFDTAYTYCTSNNDRFSFIYENKNCVCFYDKHNKLKIELIRSVFLLPTDLLDRFDFTVVKYLIFEGLDNEEKDTIFEMYHESFFEHLMMKKLVIESSNLLPTFTLERCFRYYKYGYNLCVDSKLTLINAIRNSENTIELTNNFYGGLD